MGRLRSYPCENTRSHPNSEVKWAGLVEWWVTTFESPVLKTFIIFLHSFPLFPNFFFSFLSFLFFFVACALATKKKTMKCRSFTFFLDFIYSILFSSFFKYTFYFYKKKKNTMPDYFFLATLHCALLCPGFSQTGHKSTVSFLILVTRI